MYRITGHYPMVVPNMAGPLNRKQFVWVMEPWLVDADVPAARGDDNVATKGEDP